MWLIADVPGKQPPFHIKALQELTKAWAKISKWSRKAIWTWIKNANPQRKLNLSWMIIFFVPHRVCPDKSKKEGRFRRHADLLQLGDSSVFFIGMFLQHRVVLLLSQYFREKEKNSVLWRSTCESLCCSPETSRGFFMYNDAMLRQISKLASVMSRRTNSSSERPNGIV